MEFKLSIVELHCKVFSDSIDSFELKLLINEKFRDSNLYYTKSGSWDCEQCLMVRLCCYLCELKGHFGRLSFGGSGFAGNLLLSACFFASMCLLILSNLLVHSCIHLARL